MASELYLIRHADQGGNTLLNTNLSPLGRWQAETTAIYLKEEWIPEGIDLVVSSSLKRGRETLGYLLKNFGKNTPYKIDDRLHEPMDAENFARTAPQHHKEMVQILYNNPDKGFYFEIPNERPITGLSPAKAASEMRACLLEMAKLGKRIAIVDHRLTTTALLFALMPTEEEREGKWSGYKEAKALGKLPPMDNCGITKIAIEGNQITVEIVNYNKHLEKPPIRESEKNIRKEEGSSFSGEKR